ncbi:MAG: hypothetical protein ACOCY7_03135, partial [Halodesulfurarchaeum sp.]
MSSMAGGASRPAVTVRRVASISTSTTVRDYDQLSPATMDALPELLDGTPKPVDRDVARDLIPGEIVKFTDYYRVEVR